MFKNKIHLFTLFGFKVGIDVTWFILAVLITWSLAEGLFPHFFEGFETATYWWMGVAGTLGLFVSIVFHEFCHSLVARRFGLPMKGITLFIFGGVAEMNEEPKSPKSEFTMAVAGPISSLILAGIIWLLYQAGQLVRELEAANAVLAYLIWLNVILAIFNTIPAFPLDGGRILRSILWGIKKDLKWATRVAAGFGSGFAILLIVFGVINFIGGNFIGGLWYFLLGMFIKGASQMSYQQLLVRKALSGVPVRQLMKSDPVTVPASLTVDKLVEDYVYKYHHRMFPVVDDGRLLGCVTTRHIKEMDQHQWDNNTIQDIFSPCSEYNTASPDTDSMEILSMMKESGNSRILVVEQNTLKGVVTLKDLLNYLSLKTDIEDDQEVKAMAQPQDE